MAESAIRIDAPEEIPFTQVIGGENSLLRFEGQLTVRSSNECTIESTASQIINSNTDSEVVPINTHRQGLTVPVGGKTLLFDPRGPWKIRTESTISFSGTINGPATVPYKLLIFLTPSNGGAEKVTIHINQRSRKIVQTPPQGSRDQIAGKGPPWYHNPWTINLGSGIVTVILAAVISNWIQKGAKSTGHPAVDSRTVVTPQLNGSQNRRATNKSGLIPRPGHLAKDSDLQIVHLRTIELVSRSIEDGQSDILEAQKACQQKFAEAHSVAAQRGVSGSTMERSLLSLARDAGQRRIDDDRKKVRREIEDQLVQYGLTIETMPAEVWLSTQAASYAEFERQALAAKDGMRRTVDDWTRRNSR